MKAIPYLLVFLGIGSHVCADEASLLSRDPLWSHFQFDIRQCAMSFAPALLPDVDSGQLFDSVDRKRFRLNDEFKSCVKATGWGRKGVPMVKAHNKDLTCWGGIYREDENANAARIREECIHACARHGYSQLIYDAPSKLEPKDPDDDVKEFMPSECMP